MFRFLKIIFVLSMCLGVVETQAYTQDYISKSPALHSCQLYIKKNVSICDIFGDCIYEKYKASFPEYMGADIVSRTRSICFVTMKDEVICLKSSFMCSGSLESYVLDYIRKHSGLMDKYHSDNLSQYNYYPPLL